MVYLIVLLLVKSYWGNWEKIFKNLSNMIAQVTVYSLEKLIFGTWMHYGSGAFDV